MRSSPAVVIWLLLSASSVHAQSGCGYVVANAKPPVAKDLFPVAIREVDGAKVATTGQIKLGVGLHRIGVQEQIAEERRGRARLEDLGIGKSSPALKVIEVDIKADGKYLLAAQLSVDGSDREQPGGYWEPVVWRKQLGSCD